MAQDSSSCTLGLTGSTRVTGATVHLNSINYRIEQSGVTDGTGAAIFAQLLPDRYNVSVSKYLPPDSVLKAIGKYEARVLSGQIQDLPLSQSDSIQVWLTSATLGSFVISEIYYNGAPPNLPYYFHDQFIEIYNNSDTTLYVDGLIIAKAEFGYAETDFMHAVHVFQFPGEGTDFPVAPGAMVVVAQDAINHLEANPNSIDLTGADFEYYKSESGDVDNPAVHNMIQIHSKYGIDFLYSVMNDAIILCKVDHPQLLALDTFDEMMIPVSSIIDGVEYREDLTEYQYKHLPPFIDSGLTNGLPKYSGKSIERKIERRQNGRLILMDNNNSAVDFIVLDAPTVGRLHD